MEQEVFKQRKKMIYEMICDDFYVPMKLKEMAAFLSVPKEQRRDLEEVLNALVADGKVEVTKRGRYLKSSGRFLTGIFTAHARGFGFVTAEGETEDIFIPADKIGNAFHKDTVQVALNPDKTGKRREGSIVNILSHGLLQVVGTYDSAGNFGFVIPDDAKIGRDIFIPKEHSKGAVSGHKVVVELTDYGKKGKKPEGTIVEIIGHRNDPGTDILSLVRAYDLPMEFSEKVLRQAERVAKDVSGADMAGRMDLRDLQTVTKIGRAHV